MCRVPSSDGFESKISKYTNDLLEKGSPCQEKEVGTHGVFPQIDTPVSNPGFRLSSTGRGL